MYLSSATPKINKNNLPSITNDVIYTKFSKKEYINDDEIKYLYNLFDGRPYHRSLLITICMNSSHFDVVIDICFDFKTIQYVKNVFIEMIKLPDDKLMHFLTNGYAIHMTDICLLSNRTHLMTGLKIDTWTNLYTTINCGSLRLIGPHKLSLDAFTFLSKYFVYSKPFVENLLKYCYTYEDFNDDYFNVIKNNIVGLKLKIDFKVSDHCINELFNKCQLKININYPLCTMYSLESIELILKNNCYVPLKFKLINDTKYIDFVKKNTKTFELFEKYLPDNSINKILAFYNDDYLNKITLDEFDFINIIKETKNKAFCRVDVQKILNKYPQFINIDTITHIINSYPVPNIFSCLCQIMNNFNDVDKQILLFNIQNKCMQSFINMTKIDTDKPNPLFVLTESMIIHYCISLSRPIKTIMKFIDNGQITSIDELFIIMKYTCSKNTQNHIMEKYGDRLKFDKDKLSEYTVEVKFNHLQIVQITL